MLRYKIGQSGDDRKRERRRGESSFRKLEYTGSLYPDASQFNGKVAGERVQSGVQQTAAAAASPSRKQQPRLS